MSPLGRWYGDLVVVVFLTAGAIGAIAGDVPGRLRAAAVVPLVTVVPGYALMAFVYPRSGTDASNAFDEGRRGLTGSQGEKTGINTIERIVLSVLSTIVIVPVVALGANFTPWGITTKPILAGLVGLTAVFILGAAAQRLRLPSGERAAPNLPVLSTLLYSRDSSGLGSRDIARVPFNIALIVAIVLFALSLGYAAANPPIGDEFTELYVQTDDVTGDTESMYPSEFAANETRPLPLAVTNHESAQTEYGLVVLQQTVERTESDDRVTDTVSITREQFSLAPRETWTESVAVSPTTSGDNLRLVVLLYRGDIPDDPSTEGAYRTLRLPIDVEPGGGA